MMHFYRRMPFSATHGCLSNRGSKNPPTSSKKTTSTFANVTNASRPFGPRQSRKFSQKGVSLQSCAWPKWVRLRSEEHTSDLQSLMRISYAVFRLNTHNIHSPLHRPPPP